MTRIMPFSPRCARCGTRIGWTRVIRGHHWCWSCVLRAAQDEARRSGRGRV